MGVYVCNILLLSSFADRVTLCPDSTTFLAREAFPFLSLLFNLGVMISSLLIPSGLLPVIPAHKLHWVPRVQFLNTLLWAAESKLQLHRQLPEIPGFTILGAEMFFCGLVSGTNYVTGMHHVNHSESLPSDLRELCINLTLSFGSFLCVVAAALAAWMNSTVLSEERLFPGGCGGGQTAFFIFGEEV